MSAVKRIRIRSAGTTIRLPRTSQVPADVPPVAPPVPLSVSSDDDDIIEIVSSPPRRAFPLFVVSDRHSGQSECSGCHSRIPSDAFRVDYRVASSPIRHCHVDCIPRYRQMTPRIPLMHMIQFPVDITLGARAHLLRVVEARSTLTDSTSITLDTVSFADEIWSEDSSVEIIDPSIRPLFLILNQHAGRCDCCECNARIPREQIRVDFKRRGHPIRHCHLTCVPDFRNVPPPLSSLIRFSPNVSADTRQHVITTVESRMSANHNTIILDPVIPLTQQERVVRREEELRQRTQILRETTQSRQRYFAARRNPHIFEGHAGMFDESIFGGQTFYGNRSIGLGEEVLASLPRYLCDASSTSETCVICIENMNPGQEVIALPCFHRFHAACIEGWLHGSKLCPIDKVDVEQYAGRIDVNN